MSYVDVYRMWFTNDGGDDVIIHISDTTSGTGITVFHDMQNDRGDWLTQSAKLSSANDGEDKTSIIRSLRFSCTFISTATYNVDLFTEGEDNRWLVQVYLLTTSTQPIFTGYLVPEGAKEIFLDHELFGVELTASDLLQSIGETPLKNGTAVPKGKYLLIQYVSWCLQSTFLQLPIKVVYSLRDEHHGGPDDCFLGKIYEEALSFETNINEREDCLTVLKKILLGCFITQVNSEWWIVRVDEMDNAPYTVYSYTYDGAYLGNTTANYLKPIGINESIKIVNEDAQIFPERKVKFTKQTFRFETWQEIICNIQYSRGTLNGSITVPAGYQAFNPVECWINGKNPHGSSYTSPDVPGYVRKKVTNGYVEESILVLPKLPSASTVHYWQTEKVPVNAGDKFTFSVDRRLDTDHTGSGTANDSIFKIRLRGDDGTYWSMIGNAASGKIGSWKQGTGGFPVQSYDWIYTVNNEDESQWTTHEVEVMPVPVSGNVEIMLFQSNLYGLVNDTYFSNIRFDYIPIIDGVYQQVTGQYHNVYNDDNRKANKDDEIFISDAVSPNWKGVLWRDLGGGFYERVKNVYDYRYGTTGGLGLDRFGAYQAYALWNQYNRKIRKIQANLKGIDSNIGAIPTVIHKFQFTDPSEATDNKLYQMLGFDMDLATCEWSGTFADVFDMIAGKDYAASHEFKYTTK